MFLHQRTDSWEGANLHLRLYRSLLLIAAVIATCILASGLKPSYAAHTGPSCKKMEFEAAHFSLCSFSVPIKGLKLFLRGRDGSHYGNFERLVAAVRCQGKSLRFAMNAGMYHEDRTPVGLFVQQGMEATPLNLDNGYGNFFLKPNGVFYFDDQTAGVLTAKAFRARKLKPKYATQSGPMLIIDGKLHPRFLPNSKSRKIRNGVGISRNHKMIWFVISDDPVNFHTFARFFRDRLGARNALYLDGSVSQLYAPELNRRDAGVDLGPIVGVLEDDNSIATNCAALNRF